MQTRNRQSQTPMCKNCMKRSTYEWAWDELRRAMYVYGFGIGRNNIQIIRRKYTWNEFFQKDK